MSLINVATLEMIKDILKGVTIPKKATIAEQLGEDTVGSTSVPIYLNKGVAAQATDVVNTSAAQTISAVKTFSVAPKISATLSSSLNDTTVVHAQWVNARIAAEIENIGSSGSGSGGSSDVDLSVYATTEWVESTLEAYATTEWVASRIAEAQLSGGEVDLSNYVTLSTEQIISGTKTFSAAPKISATLDSNLDDTTAVNAKWVNDKISFEKGTRLAHITDISGATINSAEKTLDDSLYNYAFTVIVALTSAGTYLTACYPSAFFGFIRGSERQQLHLPASVTTTLMTYYFDTNLNKIIYACNGIETIYVYGFNLGAREE